MIRMRVSAASQRADLHLLLVAARQRLHLGVDRRRLDLQAIDLILSARRRQAAASSDPVADNLVEAGDADIVANRLLADQAVAAILRHQPEAERNGLVGAVDRRFAPVDQDLPSRCPGQAP